MKEKEFIEQLRKTAKILEPFIQSYNAGSLRWDATAYVRAAKTKKPDPYALAWWSTLNTMVGLLEGQGLEIAEEQKEYIRRELCGGMGSFSDFRLDASDWGKGAEEANKELDAARLRLSDLLSS